MKNIHTLKTELAAAETATQTARQNYLAVLAKVEAQDHEPLDDAFNRANLTDRLSRGLITLEKFEREFVPAPFQKRVDYSEVKLTLKAELRARKSEEDVIRLALHKAIKAKAESRIALQLGRIEPALLAVFAEWRACLDETRQQYTHDAFFHSLIMPIITGAELNRKIEAIRAEYSV